MQLFAPAHLFFVLWLLAAAAPAATMLMKGAVLPLGVASAECRPVKACAECRNVSFERRTEDARSRITTTAGICVLTFVVPVASPSVLHTAVQRHRPKKA